MRESYYKSTRALLFCKGHLAFEVGSGFAVQGLRSASLSGSFNAPGCFFCSSFLCLYLISFAYL